MDAGRFTELLRTHRGLIYKIAFAYCRNPTEREDVIQEIAAQLWRARDRYDSTFRETTWIYRIALNVAISCYRRTYRHGAREVGLDTDAFATEAVEPSPALEHLLRVIDGLRPLDKALVLLYLDDNDHAAIAEVLGISTSNVGTKLARIKHELRASVAMDVTDAKEDSHGAR
ncbi:MAG: sigma-70 family RNA polymerase sigma factor [Kofleriaceae bacterium]